MKKLGFILLALIVMLLVNVSGSITARANTGVLAYQFYFDPKETGSKGGDVGLWLEVTNNGTRNLTWVKIVVNTDESFTKRWSGLLLKPHESITLTATVPFQSADVDVSKKLTISVGTDEGVDDEKSASFTIKSTSYVLHRAISQSEDRIHTGDTVDFTCTFMNGMKSGNIEGLSVYIRLIKGGQSFYGTLPEDLGDLQPGQSATITFRYKFKDTDTGDIFVYCYPHYMFLGREYITSNKLTSFDVSEPAPSPTAAPTEAPPTQPPATEPPATEPPATETPITAAPAPAAPTAVDPAAAATMTPASTTPAPTASAPVPSPSPAASPTATASSQPAATVEAATPTTAPSATPDAQAQANPSPRGPSSALIIIIAAAAVVLAGGVATVLLLIKRKPGKQ